MNLMLLRHYWIRLRAVARDPGALLLLALVGTVAAWPTSSLAAVFRGFGQGLGNEWMGVLFLFILLLLFPPLVALSVTGMTSRGARSSGYGRVVPALPIGPRSRALAEALVGLTLVLGARTPVLLVIFSGGQSVPWMVISTALVLESASFTLLALPLFLAWSSARRLDGLSLAFVSAVTALVSAAAFVGVYSGNAGGFAFLGSVRGMAPALAFSGTLSTLILALGSREWMGRRSMRATSKPSLGRSRVSPGPLAQFRRDQLLGTVRWLGLYLALAILIPWSITLIAAAPTSMRPAPFLLFLLLLGTPVVWHPLGLRLIPSGSGEPSALFSGHFGSAWSTLPVRRETVLRAAYLHGALVTALLCALFATILPRHKALPLLAFELAAVPLVAACVLCAAAGDRRRGLLALGALLGFQFGVPVFVTLAGSLAPTPLENSWLAFIVPAYVLAFVGGIPPLVHLRRQRAVA